MDGNPAKFLGEYIKRSKVLCPHLCKLLLLQRYGEAGCQTAGLPVVPQTRFQSHSVGSEMPLLENPERDPQCP